jgi:hypothetical protein
MTSNEFPVLRQCKTLAAIPPTRASELQKFANVLTFMLQREIGRFKIGVHNPGAIQAEMHKPLLRNY